jgi:pilus assembly protein CpaB
VTRRILTIIVAIVLAVIGTTAVLIYVRQADQRALAGQKAVTVLVATQQVPAGTTARSAMTNGWLVGQKYPASSVPSDALSSITPNVAGLVFTSNLAAGQLLTRPILGVAVASSSSLPIPRGMVAVTIQMCVDKAVAGFIQAGSKIAIFNTLNFSGPPVQANGSCQGINPTDKQKNFHTRLVLNNIQVLAVGNAPPSSGTGATSTAFSQNTNNSTSGQTTELVTVAVTQADAERVIDLATLYLPYMALLGNASGTTPDGSIKP